MLIIDLTTIFGLLLLGLLSPGPSVVAVIATSLGQGRRAGLIFAMGIACGTTTLGALASLGFNQVIAQNIWLFYAFKFLGAAYLCFLGYRALRSAAAHSDLMLEGGSAPERSDVRTYLAGLSIHLTNPKAILVWGAMISTSSVQNPPLWYFAVLLGGAFCLSLLINGGYAVVMSSPRLRSGYLGMRRPIQGLFGGLFILAGLKVLTTQTA